MAASDQERDNAYRAVGRYVVEFSRLVFHMRTQIIGRITKGTPNEPLGVLALGEATAHPVAQAFFAICQEVTDLDDEERKIARRLNEAVNQAIKIRNDITHGDWWIGFGRKESGAMGDPLLWRVKPARRAGAFQAQEIPAKDLDALSDALWELRQQVAEFGDLCFGRHPSELMGEKSGLRVRDIFALDDGKVVRTGPSAGLHTVHYT